jgi:hypothetical protein
MRRKPSALGMISGTVAAPGTISYRNTGNLPV